MKRFFVYYFYLSSTYLVCKEIFFESQNKALIFFDNLDIIVLSIIALLLLILQIEPRFYRNGKKLKGKIYSQNNLEINIIGINPTHKILSLLGAKTRELKLDEWAPVLSAFSFYFLIAVSVFVSSGWGGVITHYFLLSGIKMESSFDFPLIISLIPILLGFFFFQKTLNVDGGDKSYFESKNITLLLDPESKVLRAVKGLKEDIPLHTLNSFRRHPFYPTGIIHNNSFLVNSPAIDWRIATNQNIGTTDELIEYLNDLILQAKIEEKVRIENQKN